MDITIKGVPTQAIADRLMNIATNLIDAYYLAEATKITTEKEELVLTEKEAFRTANNLESLVKVEEPKKEELITEELITKGE